MAQTPSLKLNLEIDQATIAAAVADALESVVHTIRAAYGIGSSTKTVTPLAPPPPAGEPAFAPEPFKPIEIPPALVEATATPPLVHAAPTAVEQEVAQAFFTGFASPETDGQIVTPPAPAAPVSESEKPKRKRRTKAEIEADRLREANELLAKQQAAAAAPPQAPQPQAQIPQIPQAAPQPQAQIPQAAPQQFPPLAVQTSQQPAPGAVAPSQPTPSDWTPAWGYQGE